MGTCTSPGRPTWCDGLLTAVLLGLSVWAFLALSRHLAGAALAQVFENGQLVRQVALAADGRVAVAAGRLVLEVRGGRIRVLQSDCDGQVCVRSGWISQPSQSLVCAPHRVVITITGTRPPEEYDAVTR